MPLSTALPPEILAIALSLLAVLAIRQWQARLRVPCINSRPFDFFRTRVQQEFAENAAQLLAEGNRKYGGQPYKVITTLGERVILPASYISWVEKHPDLDHQAQVAEEFFGSYPGFEGIGAFNDPNKFVIDLVKKKMSSMRGPMLEVMQDAAKSILEEEFGDSIEYHPVEWSRVSTKLVSRMSSSIFVGKSLAHDEQWQAIIHSYTFNLMNACRVLRTWPAVLRPIAVWFIKEAKLCRVQIAEARKIVASNAPDEAVESTAFAWMDARADPAVIQLALAAGALHTTSQLLNQALLDLAYAGNQGKAIVEELRSECQDCKPWTDGGISPSMLPKIVVLEACIKETQRLKPQTMTNLDRLALKPVTLPNGLRLPKGTMISVDQSTMWDKQTWGEDAMAWNPLNWIQFNATGEAEYTGPGKLVNSSNRHFAFGKGRFICPGRFLVNGELKIALSLILDRWDVRLSQKDFERIKRKSLERVPWVPYGFEMLADERIVVEVRNLR